MTRTATEMTATEIPKEYVADRCVDKYITAEKDDILTKPRHSRKLKRWRQFSDFTRNLERKGK